LATQRLQRRQFLYVIDCFDLPCFSSDGNVVNRKCVFSAKSSTFWQLVELLEFWQAFSLCTPLTSLSWKRNTKKTLPYSSNRSPDQNGTPIGIGLFAFDQFSLCALGSDQIHSHFPQERAAHIAKAFQEFNKRRNSTTQAYNDSKFNFDQTWSIQFRGTEG
jgi:hypothetical protein